MDWNYTDANNRFSEVVDRALSEGCQRMRCRDGAVVVVDTCEYDRLVGERPAFKDYLMQGESLEGLDLIRDRSPGRSDC